MIETVFFDCGGVLVRDMAWDEIYKVTDSKCKEILQKTISIEWDKMKVDETYEEEKFWNALASVSSLSKEQIEKLKIVIVEKMIMWPDVLKIAEKLKSSKSVQLAIISNHCSFWFNAIRHKYPEIFKIFDQVVIVSCDAHCAKPDLSIYQFALEKARKQANKPTLSPTNCLLIDDKTRNTETAEKFGFKTIVFNAEKQPASDLENSLVKFGLKF